MTSVPAPGAKGTTRRMGLVGYAPWPCASGVVSHVNGVTSFPASYAGDYFFADLCGGWIHRLDAPSYAFDAFTALVEADRHAQPRTARHGDRDHHLHPAMIGVHGAARDLCRPAPVRARASRRRRRA